MNFVVLRENLRSALDKIKATIKIVRQFEWSEFVKFEVDPRGITLTGYDLETGVIASLDADTLDSGEFLVNLDKLAALTAKLSGETLECSVDGESMTIKCGRSNVKIPTRDTEAYPAIPSLDTENRFVIGGETLSDMIRQTVFAVASADNKTILQGELFEIADNRFDLVAIDGYRLAVRTEPVSTADSYSFVVRGDTLRSVAKLAKGDVTLIPSKRHIIFDFGKTKIFTRLLEGDFHNYKGSIPNRSESTAIVPVRPLIECLERFSLLINGKLKSPLRCEFGDGKLSMAMKTSLGEMTDYVDVDFSGKPITIGFNNQYLLDTLKASESDKVKLELGGAQSPMKAVPLDGNAYTYLILPVRLKN